MPLAPGQTTLADVRLAARRRADMEHSPFVSDDEWNALIASAHQELYGLLCQEFGSAYQLSSHDLVTAGADTYALPEDFFKLHAVHLHLSGDQWKALRRCNVADLNGGRFGVAFAPYGTDIRYALAGSSIRFVPAPAAGRTIRLWYAPRLAVPTNDEDVIDGVNGWEELLVIDAAIKALQKEESDVSVLLAQKNMLLARIRSEAANRDVGPQTVTDTQSGDFGWGCW